MQKWCDQAWLHVIYLLGVGAFTVLIIRWNNWDIPQRLMCMLAAMIPLHVFEENTFPGGFFFMNNLGQKSSDPRMYPQNMFTNMLTNLGAELIVIILTVFASRIETVSVVIVILFGLGEVIHHSMDGCHMYKRYHKVGKRTLYGPGTGTAFIALLPMSAYGCYYLTQTPFKGADILIGAIGLVAFVFCFILIPFKVSTKIQSRNYTFGNIGYFEKYETRLDKEKN